MCGDRNDLKMEQIQSADPVLRQLVTFCTNKNQDKILDIVMTDLFSGYQQPTKIEAIKIDDEKEGVPSDHCGVEMKPRSNWSTSKVEAKKESFEVQPMPESLVAEFGQKLMEEKWSCIEGDGHGGKFRSGCQRTG